MESSAAAASSAAVQPRKRPRDPPIAAPSAQPRPTGGMEDANTSAVTQLCMNTLERDGGAFGCTLPAGHEGAHEVAGREARTRRAWHSAIDTSSMPPAWRHAPRQRATEQIATSRAGAEAVGAEQARTNVVRPADADGGVPRGVGRARRGAVPRRDQSSRQPHPCAKSTDCTLPPASVCNGCDSCVLAANQVARGFGHTWSL